MMLGDLIATFEDETSATTALLALGDLRLLAALRAFAAAHRVEPGAVVARAVRRYAAAASDEEWVTLLGDINRSTDPALAFVRRALVAAEIPV